MSEPVIKLPAWFQHEVPALEVIPVLTAIVAERKRQDEIWGKDRDYPDGTGGGLYKHWVTIARNSCDRAHREGQLTFRHIFDEEAAEVLAEEDPVKLREELIQVAAVAVHWIQALDRRAGR